MTNSNYKRNKAKAVFINTEPTLTDQAGERDTDINVIVAQFGIHGQAPTGAKDPVYGDFTGMPTDLRGTIEMARRVNYHKNRLPPQLAELTTEELLALTPEQVKAKLTPVDEPTETPKEETK